MDSTVDATKKRRHRLNLEDYERIVAYIEDLDMFRALYGTRTKTQAGSGKFISKATSFDIMAARLSGKNGFPVVTGDHLKKRFERYVEKYKKAREIFEGKGVGLTETELLIGMTMEEKLNAKCPHFHRMHSVFVSSSNIDPPAVVSIGLPSDDGVLGLNSQQSAIEDRTKVEREKISSSGEPLSGEKAVVASPDRPTKVKAALRRVPPTEDELYEVLLKKDGLRRVPPTEDELREVLLEKSTEFRRKTAFLEYRMAFLAEKRKSRESFQKEESKKRICNMVVELSRAGKSVDEIKSIMSMIDEM